MSVVQCDGCGRDVYTSNDGGEHYCPDCAGDHVPPRFDHDEQAANQEADEWRHEIHSGKAWRKTL